MSFTMEDFNRQYIKEYFGGGYRQRSKREALQALPLEQQQEVLDALPPERRLAGLSAEQIRQHLEQLTANRSRRTRKPRRKK